MNAMLRHRTVAPCAQQLDRQRSRRPSARVEAVQSTGSCVLHDGKEIAADSIHHRRDDAHHGIGSNDRIDRVAAARQHHCARLRRKRALRGDDAARRDDHRTRL